MSTYPENINAKISPIEFELLVKDFLNNLGKELKSFEAVHNVKIKCTDGNYQIDVYAVFNYLGIDFKILIECKKHKSKIKRDVVQLLYDKIRATGSHKGIIFSTSGFQEGALKYAQEHGIALIRIIEGRFTYFTKSEDCQNFNPPPFSYIPKFVGEFREGNTTSYLQKGYFDSLSDFLFKTLPLDNNS